MSCPIRLIPQERIRIPDDKMKYYENLAEMYVGDDVSPDFYGEGHALLLLLLCTRVCVCYVCVRVCACAHMHAYVLHTLFVHTTLTCCTHTLPP